MAEQFDYGFVIPLKEEAKPLLARIKDKKELTYGSRKIIIGNFGKFRISLIISGCGKIKVASATQLLIDRYPAKLFLHYGTAGAISPSLKIGDVIIATHVIEHDVQEKFPSLVPPPVHTIEKKLISKIKDIKRQNFIFAPILSGDEDIINRQQRNELFAQHKALSVDWESAGFVLTCQLNNTPCLVLRGISDYAYEYTTKEYEKNQQSVVRKLVEEVITVTTLL